MRKLILFSLTLALLFTLMANQLAMAEAALTIDLSLDNESAGFFTDKPITARWQVSGGAYPYIYEYEWKTGRDGVYGFGASRGSFYDETSCTFQPGNDPDGYFWVKVEDGNGDIAEKRVTFKMRPGADCVFIHPKLDKQAVDASKGESITASWEVEGGEAPYTYSFAWFAVAEDGEKIRINYYDNQTINSTSYAPEYSPKGEFWIHVEDSKGRSDGHRIPFQVMNGKVIPQLTISLDKQSVNVAAGESITARWQLTGAQDGEYRFDYNWSLSELEKPDMNKWKDWVSVKRGYGSEENPVLTNDTFKPAWGKIGRLEVTAEATTEGMFDRKATSTFAIVNAPEVEPLALDLTLNKTAVNLGAGESVTATWKASGGIAPYTYNYSWAINMSENIGDSEIIPGGYQTKAETASFVPKKGIRGGIIVTVNDTVGRETFKMVEFDIVNQEVEPTQPSDVTGDGKLDEQDLMAVIDHILGIKLLESPDNADYTGDDKVTIEDLARMIDRMLAS